MIISPTKMNLILYKGKIKAAKKGHSLLEKKRDTLRKRFKVIMVALAQAKKTMGDDAKNAFISLAEAQHAAGSISQKVRNTVQIPSIRIATSTDNVAGVRIPKLILKDTKGQSNQLHLIGLSRGGIEVKICKAKFDKLLKNLVKIGSLQTSFLSLDDVLRITSRRVNALEHVVIPKYEKVRNYIRKELEEQETETFLKLKKVLANKQKIQAQEDLENEIRLGKEYNKEGIQTREDEALQFMEDSDEVQDSDHEEDVIDWDSD